MRSFYSKIVLLQISIMPIYSAIVDAQDNIYLGHTVSCESTDKKITNVIHVTFYTIKTNCDGYFYLLTETVIMADYQAQQIMH